HTAAPPSAQVASGPASSAPREVLAADPAVLGQLQSAPPVAAPAPIVAAPLQNPPEPTPPSTTVNVPDPLVASGQLPPRPPTPPPPPPPPDPLPPHGP